MNLSVIKRSIWIVTFLSFTALGADEHSAHPVVPNSKPATSSAGGGLKKDIPVSKPDETRVAVEVPPEQQLRMGIKVATAERKAAEHVIRTVGAIAADETREAHIHTRVNGWIDTIQIDSVGKAVKKGEPLFGLYSPELVSTQEELLAARGQRGIGAEIAKASSERLRLWGVSQLEIDEIIKGRKAKRAVIFRAPVSGFVISKNAIRGMYVTPELELYYIAELSKVWVVITLYEHDVSTVKVGDTAQIELSYSPGKILSAPISFIYPEINTETRTARARIEIANPNQELKPGMFAQVEIKKNLGDALLIPDEAVIDTGTRQIVFVKSGPVKFEPRTVKVGPRVGNFFTVIDGLKEGEQLVTSAHFLIDAESKLQASLRRGGPAPGAHSGH